MKTFLLIIDIQEGFISDETESAKKRIGNLLKASFFDYSIASVYQNTPGGPLVKFMGWTRFFSKEEQQLAGIIKKYADSTVYKQRYSAVNEQLFTILRQNNGGELPEAVFIAGVDTECCVLATAMELFESGIRPIVLADYCATTGGGKYHEAGVLSLESLIGENNIFSGEIESKSDIKKILDFSKKNMEIQKEI
ncbi:MAG: cysteine hydrolase [Clostridia bacterium]|nr:cysteine hydrolase [Clostridia bacterium]